MTPWSKIIITQLDTMVKSTMTETVPSWGRGGTAVAMAQNEQMTKSIPRSSSSHREGSITHTEWCVVWTVWWAAAKRGRLVVSQFVRCENFHYRKHVFELHFANSSSVFSAVHLLWKKTSRFRISIGILVGSTWGWFHQNNDTVSKYIT